MGESKIVTIDHSRHYIKRMLAEKRRKEIVRRRITIAAIAAAITLAVISVGVAAALAAGADESGVDESRGISHSCAKEFINAMLDARLESAEGEKW